MEWQVPSGLPGARIGSAQYNLLEDTLSSQIKQWGKKLLVRRRQGTVRLEDPIPLENTFEASPSGSARQAFRDDSREFCRLTRYNPDVLRPTNVGQGALVVARLAKIVASISSYTLLVAFTRGGVQTDDTADVKALASELRQGLIDLGPTFIKVGQVLANRPDIIRADYMEELTKLQDQVPSFPTQIAFQMIEDGIGRPISEVFSEISPQPIAAASLGQVYKARLIENGEWVAVKVQRPSVEEAIKRDLYIIRLMAKAVNKAALRRVGVDAVTLVDEFSENLLEETDYVQELRNIQSFQRNFKGDTVVKIPFAYPHLTSRKVLVMEWIDGVRCTDLAALDRFQVPVAEFIRVGVESGMRQLLEFGLFHGDPHPGNVFAMADGRIAYVDFGAVAEISEASKEILIDAVVHAMDRDFDKIAEDMMRLGFIAEGSDRAPIARAMEEMWEDALGKNLVDFNFRTITAQFSRLVYTSQIRVPERFALVIRTLLTQEGICLTLDKNFKLLNVAYPYVAKRLLRDPLYSSRLTQVLLRNVPGSEGPVFHFSRLFSLLRMASTVAGKGPRAVLGLLATGVDAIALVFRKPMIALNLGKGVVRWGKFRAKWAAAKIALSVTEWFSGAVKKAPGASDQGSDAGVTRK